MLALILPFLTKYWLPIAIGIAALTLATYVEVLRVENHHYQSEIVQLKTEIKKSDDTRKLLEASAEDITAKYHQSLANQYALATKEATVVQKRISNDKETAHVVLSPNAVSLFNSSKPEAHIEVPAATVRPNAGGTGTVEVTLNQLLKISAENDSNHQLCIDQVHEWQHFWSDFSKAYGAVADGAP